MIPVVWGITVSVLLYGMLSLVTQPVFAQDSAGGNVSAETSVGGNVKTTPTTPATSNTNIKTLTNPLKGVTSVGDLVNKFVEIFSYLVIIFAVLALIWVGFQFIMAQGDTAKMSELKGWLLNIVIGVAIVIGARLIISIVVNTLQATGAVDSKVIEGANKLIKNN